MCFRFFCCATKTNEINEKIESMKDIQKPDVTHSFGKLPSLKKESNGSKKDVTTTVDQKATTPLIESKRDTPPQEHKAPPPQPATQSQVTPSHDGVNIFGKISTDHARDAQQCETPIMGRAVVLRAETKKQSMAPPEVKPVGLLSPRAQELRERLQKSPRGEGNGKQGEDSGPMKVNGMLEMKRITRGEDEVKHLTVKNDDSDLPEFMKRNDIRRNSRQMLNETPLLRSKKNLETSSNNPSHNQA